MPPYVIAALVVGNDVVLQLLVGLYSIRLARIIYLIPGQRLPYLLPLPHPRLQQTPAVSTSEDAREGERIVWEGTQREW